MFTFDADALRTETDTSQRARYVRYGGVSLDTMTATEMRAALMDVFNLLYGHLAYVPQAKTGENTPSFEAYRLRREITGEEIVQAWRGGQEVGGFSSVLEHWDALAVVGNVPEIDDPKEGEDV